MRYDRLEIVSSLAFNYWPDFYLDYKPSVYNFACSSTGHSSTENGKLLFLWLCTGSSLVELDSTNTAPIVLRSSYAASSFEALSCFCKFNSSVKSPLCQVHARFDQKLSWTLCKLQHFAGRIGLWQAETSCVCVAFHMPSIIKTLWLSSDVGLLLPPLICDCNI